MGPESINSTFSPILTNVAIGYSMRAQNQFIAKLVFPNVPVASPIGQYNIWNRADFMRRQSKPLANFEVPPVASFGVTQGNFTVGHYGLSAGYTSMDIARARVGGVSDQQFINAKTDIVTNSNLVELEIQTATLVQTAGNWSSTVAGVSSGPTTGQFLQWDQASSDPVANVKAWKEALRLGYGVTANTLIMPVWVFNSLTSNAAILDRIKFGSDSNQPAEVTLNLLKQLFQITNILVPECVYNQSDEDTTAAYAYIWGAKTMWLGYVAAAPSIEEPSAGYHFSWTGDTTMGLPQGIAATGLGPQNFGGVFSPEGLFVYEYTTNRPQASWVDCHLWTTPNVTAADLGMTITGVTA